jgi:transcriptional adapter 1
MLQPADIADYIVPPNTVPAHAHEEPLRYSAQEFFLPDMSLIYGRMMLSAWEVGLDGAEEPAAELLVIAVQVLIKSEKSVLHFNSHLMYSMSVLMR